MGKYQIINNTNSISKKHKSLANELSCSLVELWWDHLEGNIGKIMTHQNSKLGLETYFPHVIWTTISSHRVHSSSIWCCAAYLIKFVSNKSGDKIIKYFLKCFPASLDNTHTDQMGTIISENIIGGWSHSSIIRKRLKT